MIYNVSNIKEGFDKILYIRIRDLMKHSIKYNMNRFPKLYVYITSDSYKYYDY